MSLLSEMFPGEQIKPMSLMDHLDNICTIHDVVQTANQTFYQLERHFEAVINLCQIAPYLKEQKAVMHHFLSAEALRLVSSNEDLLTTVRGIFVKIKDFFLRLIDAIVAFFRRWFDSNVRTRHTLLDCISTFYKRRANISDERISVLNICMLDSVQFDELYGILTSLSKDVVNASKSNDSITAATYSEGIRGLGYEIESGMIVESGRIKKIQPIPGRFKDRGWTVDTFITATQRVVDLCSASESANAVKASLQNELNAGVREIDRLNSIDRPEAAQELQNRMNDLSKKSGYVFKSAVLLQSYVEQLSVQFTDTWTNINNLSV